MKIDIDLSALSLWVDIVDAGNLSRAAVRLGMSRANVSYRLGQFERQLGQQLLLRTTRQFEPTELGLQLYQHGRSIRHEQMAAADTVQQLGKELEGTVRLSVPYGFGQRYMSGWLNDFLALHPGIHLEVVFDNQVSELVSGKVDIAVRLMTEPHDGVIARQLGTVAYAAVATPDFLARCGSPERLVDLPRLPIISSPVTAAKMRSASISAALGGPLRLQPRLLSANFHFLRDAVMRGLGVGVMPRYMVGDCLEDGRLRPLTLPAECAALLDTHLSLIYLPKRFKTRAIQTLIEFLRGHSMATLGTAET